MKLEKITYRRLFPTGNFANEAIELSGTLEPNEDPLNAYNELHKMAQELHLSKNAEIYEQMGVQERIIEPEDKRVLEIIKDIEDCDVLDVKNNIGVQVGLLGYGTLAKTHPQIEAAYLKRLEELTINQ